MNETDARVGNVLLRGNDLRCRPSAQVIRSRLVLVCP